MNALDLSPAGAWDAAEEKIDQWIEEKDYQERLKWRQLRGS